MELTENEINYVKIKKEIAKIDQQIKDINDTTLADIATVQNTARDEIETIQSQCNTNLQTLKAQKIAKEIKLKDYLLLE